RLAYTQWLLGRDEEGELNRASALELAERLNHPFTRTSAMVWAALLALDQHDNDRLRLYIEALRSAKVAHGPKPVRLFVEALEGYFDVFNGRAREGIARVRRSLDESREGEPAAPGLVAMHMRILLEACARAGEASSGLAAAAEALVMGGGTQIWEAEIRRLRASFLLALDAPRDSVEAELQKAVEVARRQGARSLELRAVENLKNLRAGLAEER
ncbi:MAG: hypothetical protein M3198_17185, partial [Actinomycetota bacterium]|nr:hypothetical protein [Actinomycetota bacterium]